MLWWLAVVAAGLCCCSYGELRFGSEMWWVLAWVAGLGCGVAVGRRWAVTGPESGP